MPDAERSLEALEEFTSSPFVPAFAKYGIRLYTIRQYDDFVNLIHEILDNGIRYMEENSQHHQGRREEALSDSLLSHFVSIGLDATAETSVGGHCDITIRNRNHGWLWLAEAKIHGAYDHLRGGVNQLLYRYAAANDGCDQGALIIFIFGQQAANVIHEWCSRMNNFTDCNEISCCDTRPNFSFFSHHSETERTGLPYSIKHCGLSLYHQPDDDRHKT